MLIVERFDLFKLGHLLRKIGRVRCVCSQRSDNPESLADSSALLALCEDVSELCRKIGFFRAATEAEILLARIRNGSIPLVPNSLEAHFDHLERSLIEEFRERMYVQIGSDGARFLDPLEVFSRPTLGAFPSATSDFQDACSCLALGLGTSAVFHLMRIVEFGLRAFAEHLGLLQVVVNQVQTKTVPLEFSEWERILNQLPQKIETRVTAMARGPEKLDAQTFYYGALQEVNAFKEAYRNHVMHSRVVYNAEDANAVLSHVQRFLGSLVKNGVSEI